MKFEEFLRRMGAALEIAGVPYMLTGSLASSFYGVPRATNDIDFVIAPDRETLIAFVRLVERAGLYVSWDEAMAPLENRSKFNVIDFSSSWKADLIVQKARQFSIDEFARRTAIALEGTTLSVAAAEDVIIAKLEWSRDCESAQQIIDAAGILRMQEAALDSRAHREMGEGARPHRAMGRRDETRRGLSALVATRKAEGSKPFRLCACD